MENDAGNVVGVPLKALHFPMLIAGESPQLDALVIGSGCHDSHTWMEGYPVYASLVTFKDMLHFNLCTDKYLVWSRSRLLHALFL